MLGKTTWAVLALICHIELFVQAHYEQSIDAAGRPVARCGRTCSCIHWKEECQHAILDELEWAPKTHKLDAAEHDAAVDDLIALVGAVDGILQAQAAADDAATSCASAGRRFDRRSSERIGATLLAAYRWQYIVSGVQHPHFSKLLGEHDDAGADAADRVGAGADLASVR